MEPSRADFCHPYQPYDIQLQFMQDLYRTMDQGKVGIFESPTGTGKSLSLICGSLTWLRDHRRRLLEEDPLHSQNSDGDPDWMVEADREQRKQVRLQHVAELEARLSEIRKREKERRRELAHGSRPLKKLRTHRDDETESGSANDDSIFLPVEYEQTDHDTTHGNVPNGSESLSSDTQKLLAKLTERRGDSNELDAGLEDTKIILCSRTHSQLTQFVNELKRVQPPPSIVSVGNSTLQDQENDEAVKHISLGSRKNLCINPKVSKLGSVTAINERCLDLQKKGVKEDQKCRFLPKKDDQLLVSNFRDHALAEIRDIEDLGDLGKKMGICPYYASRSAIPSSEIMTLPYPLLLQKSAREALGVSVKGHVVIIDEAHNLMDAIVDTYSCSMSLRDLETATLQVVGYIQKFKNRLKGQNRMYLAQIVRLSNSLSDCLRSTTENLKDTESLISPAQLVAGKGADQIQLHFLIRYLQESKLPFKVDDYHASISQSSSPQPSNPPARGSLQKFHTFLSALANPSSEGRFFASRDAVDVHIRYMLLDPRSAFQDIVEDARSVILAGGTMSPMEDYREYLFSYLPAEKLQTFSFGHVVPRENIFAATIGAGPRKGRLEFSFDKRKEERMVVELGLLLIRLCRIVPDGVVAFFPSYDYLEHVVGVWKRVKTPSEPTTTITAKATTIFQTLETIKPIFYETKTPPPANPQTQVQTAQQPTLLAAYTQAIVSPPPQSPSHRGALLLSILSGSLSEGINFSDSLCRLVLCIGLPYPNPHSAVWKAKMAHVERTFTLRQQQQRQERQQGQQEQTLSPRPKPKLQPHPQSPPPPPPTIATAPSPSTPKAASRAFYTNTTLRVVNQAVGRAIRHRGDYAAIVLVDQRWRDPSVRDKLAGWVRDRLVNVNSVKNVNTGGGGEGEVEGLEGLERGLRGFFAGREGGY